MIWMTQPFQQQKPTVTTSSVDLDCAPGSYGWIIWIISLAQCIREKEHVAYHSVVNAGLFRTADTIRAPWLGELEYIFLTMSSACDLRGESNELSGKITWRQPTLSSITKELRKLYMCCLHAIRSYVNKTNNYNTNNITTQVNLSQHYTLSDKQCIIHFYWLL